jgi:hypothetical protein
MVTLTGERRKRLARILFVFAAFFAWAGNASAVFPPLYQQPPVQPVQLPVTPTVIDPPVVISGGPVTEPVVVHQTPEPATWVSVSLGVLIAVGYTWRKGRKKQSQLIYG